MQNILHDYRVVGCAAEPQDNSAIYCHTVNAFYPCMDKRMKEFPSIIPLRNPVRVWESFKRRGNNLNIRQYREQWGCLSDLVKGKNVHYIHIDEPILRDEELASINVALGLSLRTIWPVCNAVADTNKLILTEAMGQEVPSWVMEFYKTTYRSAEDVAT